MIPRKEKLSGCVWKTQPTETRKDPAARLGTELDPLFPVQVDPRDVCLSCSDTAELMERPQLSSSSLHLPCTLPRVLSEEHPQIPKTILIGLRGETQPTLLSQSRHWLIHPR